jgi:acetyl-CoA carboxylase carboxyl transferase subunit alpha
VLGGRQAQPARLSTETARSGTLIRQLEFDSLKHSSSIKRKPKRVVRLVEKAAAPAARPAAARTYLDFEKPIADLENRVADLRTLEGGETVSIVEEIRKLEQKAKAALSETYSKLTPWQKTLVARHGERPHTLEFVGQLIEDFTPLSGDRYFAEDEAIMGGMGRFRGKSVMVIGNEKGSDTQGRIRHNFGMAKPEGYRKAVRLMELADRFSLPVITFVDTPGAYPGIGAEERGQAEAIARSTDCCLSLGVPVIAVIIGEGGSGGAIAIATANRILMLEHAIYSVISPEGAASIIWRDSSKREEAATAMKITAQDLEQLGVIDQIVREPTGGAHRDPKVAIAAVGDAIAKALSEFDGRSPADIKKQRHDRFLAIGRSL